MVYNPSTIYQSIYFEDVRAEEVRKLLTSFNKESLVLVIGNELTAIFDNSILYKMNLKIDTVDLRPVAFKSSDLLGLENTNLLMYNQYIYEFMIPMINSSNIKIDLVASKDNLREDESFESLLSMKSDEGMKFYKLHSLDLSHYYMIPIFSGFPNINKNDTVSIQLFSSINNSLIVDMCIYKKKFNRDIHMIYKILDI